MDKPLTKQKKNLQVVRQIAEDSARIQADLKRLQQNTWKVLQSTADSLDKAENKKPGTTTSKVKPELDRLARGSSRSSSKSRARSRSQ